MTLESSQVALARALLDREQSARLIVLEATPVHSLWIAGQLPLLTPLGMEVYVLEVVRDLFAAHQNCRKGVEVARFLAENSPPIHYLPTDPWRQVSATVRAQGPAPRDLALGAADFLSSDTACPEMRRDGRQSFLLVGDKRQWFSRNFGSTDILTDTRDLLLAAEEASLLEDACAVLQNVNLPGEVLDWR